MENGIKKKKKELATLNNLRIISILSLFGFSIAFHAIELSALTLRD